MLNTNIALPYEKITEFCERNHVRKLSLFGSVLREDFNPETSDIDVLVEFDPDKFISLMTLGGMQMELTEMFGRYVDLAPADSLNKYYAPEILRTAVTIYERA